MSLNLRAQTGEQENVTKTNLIMDLRKDIEETKAYFKDNLKFQVSEINRKLQAGKLNAAEADAQKKQLAKENATKMNYWVTRLENDIAFVEQNGYLPEQNDFLLAAMPTGDLYLPNMESYNKKRRNKEYLVTTSGLYLQFGSNFMSGDNLGIDDVRVWESAMGGFGYSFLTKLNRESPTFRLRYGGEVTSYTTSFHGDRYFITPDDETIIDRFNEDYENITFGQTQFIVPVHLEIGQYEREGTKSKVRYNLKSGFSGGIGGYLGLNLVSQTRIDRERNGRDITLITRDDFDNQVFLYGLDAYVAYKNYRLFGRLALNDVFNSGSVGGS